eukprot:2936074-Ditylum_brightwellii.AAC.1
MSRWAHRCAITFTIDKNKAVNPREKIAALFSVIVQQCPNTVLEEWDKKSKKQSITNREDIPTLKEDLLRYVPHEWRNRRLTAQWNITSDTKFSAIIENPAIVHHLNRFK